MVNTTGVTCVLSQTMLSDTVYTNPEISELECEILALNVEGKKLLNIKWNETSLFFKNMEDSTTLILPNPNDPEKGGPFWAQVYH